MLKPYQCPNAYRTRHARFMLCRKLMDFSKHTYTDAAQCATAICAFGYWCPNTARAEVSVNAKRECALLYAEDMNGGKDNGRKIREGERVQRRESGL